MDERPEQAGAADLLQVGARLGEPPADAEDRPDPELMPDEGVERDPARHDVPAGELPGQVERVEHLGLDERELVALAGAAEGSPAVAVAIARETVAGACLRLVVSRQGSLGVGGG